MQFIILKFVLAFSANKSVKFGQISVHTDVVGIFFGISTIGAHHSGGSKIYFMVRHNGGSIILCAAAHEIIVPVTDW